MKRKSNVEMLTIAQVIDRLDGVARRLGLSTSQMLRRFHAGRYRGTAAEVSIRQLMFLLDGGS